MTENDLIQRALCGDMEYRVQQQERTAEQDAWAELADRNNLLLDAEKRRKHEALAQKRMQVVTESAKDWYDTS